MLAIANMEKPPHFLGKFTLRHMVLYRKIPQIYLCNYSFTTDHFVSPIAAAHPFSFAVLGQAVLFNVSLNHIECLNL